MSQHYRMSWKEVTQLNIWAFNHRAKFLLHLNKKKATNSKGKTPRK